MNPDHQETFITRWSRRKLQDEQDSNREDERLQNSELVEPVEPLEQTSVEPLDSSAPPLTDDDMPPVESLNPDSDFSMFMASGVSDALRNRALKKLFGAPLFNIRDGLDEYDEDYTSFEKLGDLVTCDMKHQIEMEARKLQREQDEAETEPEAIDAAKVDSVEDSHDEAMPAKAGTDPGAEPNTATRTVEPDQETVDEPKP